MILPLEILRTSRSIFVLSSFISFLCILAFSLYVEPGLNPESGRSHVIGLQLAFQKSEGMKFLEAWGEQGRNHFLKTMWIDFVFPAAYSLFLASLLARSIHRLHAPGWMQIIAVIPFDAALLDCIENIIEIMFVNNPDSLSESLFYTHSVIASLKWLLAFAAISFLAAFNIFYLIKSTGKSAS